MQNLKSKEYTKELPVVKKFIDILEDDDIFIFAVLDESEEEYKIYEDEQLITNKSSITVPKFQISFQNEYNHEQYTRPDHYIVYSSKNSNNYENELPLDETFLLSTAKIEQIDIKKILIFIEDNFDFQMKDNIIKNNLAENFPKISVINIDIIYDVNQFIKNSTG